LIFRTKVRLGPRSLNLIDLSDLVWSAGRQGDKETAVRFLVIFGRQHGATRPGRDLPSGDGRCAAALSGEFSFLEGDLWLRLDFLSNGTLFDPATSTYTDFADEFGGSRDALWLIRSVAGQSRVRRLRTGIGMEPALAQLRYTSRIEILGFCP
jgi:hypothetical protein